MRKKIRHDIMIYVLFFIFVEKATMFGKKRTDVSAKRREIAKKITEIRLSIEDLKTEDPSNATSYSELSQQLKNLINRLKTI